VIRRWKEKERRSKSMGLRRKGHGLKGRSGAGHDVPSTTRIKDISHLPIRQRVKRQHSPSPVTSDPPQNLTELNYVQTQLGLADPLLPSQWHLVNTQLPEVELNVTGAWGEGITGQGVTVAIIDDGLDMDSDDLAGNFVSTESHSPP
jgi:kexin